MEVEACRAGIKVSIPRPVAIDVLCLIIRIREEDLVQYDVFLGARGRIPSGNDGASAGACAGANDDCMPRSIHWNHHVNGWHARLEGLFPDVVDRTEEDERTVDVVTQDVAMRVDVVWHVTGKTGARVSSRGRCGCHGDQDSRQHEQQFLYLHSRDLLSTKIKVTYEVVDRLALRENIIYLIFIAVVNTIVCKS